MNSDNLNLIVHTELAHIPRGDLTQNELRMVYNMERRHDLARDPLTSKEVSLRAAVASVQSRCASFMAAYDHTFFGI